MPSHPADDSRAVAAGSKREIRRAGEHRGDAGDASPRALLAGGVVLFGAVAALVAFDAVGDVASGTTLVHVAVDVAAAVLAATGAVAAGLALARRVALFRREGASLARELVAAREDAARWRHEARALVTGLGEAIDKQLVLWGLTAAECEVALLLLKGLSLKEIAAVRDTSERTARQQALAVYRKADLGGRAELAAFFLEDLLPPAPPAGPRSRAP